MLQFLRSFSLIERVAFTLQFWGVNLDTKLVADFLEKTVNALMEVFEISPADMTVILSDVQSNVNPYVSAGELDAPTEEMDRPVTEEELDNKPVLCDECRHLDLVTCITLEPGKCRNCGKDIL